MSHVVFRFYEELNDFLPRELQRREFPHVFHRRAAVKDMIESLGVPHTEVDLVLINGESVDFGAIVHDGDRVSVYPVFESLDISSLVRLRPQPLRTPRFIADVHLGRLARYLRLLGFDTLYRNDYADDQLAQISAGERRILLTRDRDLLKRRIVTRGCFVRSDRPLDQLRDLLERLDLYRTARPCRRCVRCNGVLSEVGKLEVEDQLEPLTRAHYHRFRRCTACGQIYWQGSHSQAMQRLVRSVLTGPATRPGPAATERGYQP